MDVKLLQSMLQPRADSDSEDDDVTSHSTPADIGAANKNKSKIPDVIIPY